MQELGKLINKTVESSLLKTHKQISDLQNGYIRRNNALLEETTRLRSEIMFYQKEKERYEEAKIEIKKLKKIIIWTYGVIIAVVIIELLFKILGWV